MRAILAATILALITGCASFRDTSVPMETVSRLDAARYSGTWYEIERFPVRFQRGCTATTATYDVTGSDTLSVLNRCRQDSPDGPLRQIEGEARVLGPGRLSVRLDGVPFSAPYWVLWVAPDYSAAVVGVPQGSAGWILARQPSMPAAQLREARAVLARNGYDLSQLIAVTHQR